MKCGEVHEYFGRTLDYTKRRKVTINMKKYIKPILKDLPDGYNENHSLQKLTAFLM